MVDYHQNVADAAGTSVLATNKVLRNTYMLLSMTLACTALCAWFSMQLALPHPGLIITLVGYFGLLFLTHKFKNSALGLVFIFMLTGFMGFTLGPILSSVGSLPNGDQTIMTAFGLTATIFLALSGYVLVTRKDFSFMGGMLTVGIITAFVLGLIAYFVGMPNLQLAVSAMFVLLMSGLILYETSQIVNGGERNYILATVTLWVSVYNLFSSLLHLLMAFGGDD